MGTFKVEDSGERRIFLTGSRRDTDESKPRFDLISTHAARREAEHMAKGAKKYGENNWALGQPVSVFLASLMRHVEAFRSGERTEDHLAAIRFNAGGIMHMEEEVAAGRLPAELLDLPFYKDTNRVSSIIQLWVGRQQVQNAELGVTRAQIAGYLMNINVDVSAEDLSNILINLRNTGRLYVFEDGVNDPLWQVYPQYPDEELEDD